MAKKSKNSFLITGRVVDQKSQGVAGLKIEAWEKGRRRTKPIANATTDNQGRFRIEFTQDELKKRSIDPQPGIFFRVYDGRKLIRSTEDSVLWNIKTGEQPVTIEVTPPSKKSPRRIDVDVPAPKPARIPLADVLQAGGAQPSLREVFQRNHLKELKDLFSPKGVKTLQDAGLSSAEQRKLLAIGKFAAASGNVGLGERLAKSGLTSLSRLSRMPMRRIEGMLGRLNEADQEALRRLYYTTRIVSKQMQEATIEYQRSRSRDGDWYRTSDRDIAIASGIEIPEVDFCGDGDSCYNVFSAIAYVFDLLGFILDNWGFPTDTLEQIFRQEIDTIDCETGFATVPQIRLAVEILEKYLGSMRLPGADSTWVQSCKAAFVNLLAIAGLKPGDLPAGVDLSPSSVDLATLDRVAETLRNARKARIDEDYPLPEEPTSGNTDAEKEYLTQLATVEQQRSNAKREFELQMNEVLAQLMALYRQKLIEASGKTVQWLERELFIDLRNARSLLTTRVTQLVQSIQSLVLAVRTGEIRDHSNQDLALLPTPDVEFGKAWDWLGNYATWSAAMYALVYPENLIALPAYRPSQTEGFYQTLLSMTSPATRQNVDLAIQAYDDYLTIIGELKPISAHVIKGTLFLFATTRGQLWMNKVSLTNPILGSWQLVSEIKENMSLWTTALFTEKDQIAMAVAYKIMNEDPASKDREKVAKIRLFRILLEKGMLRDDLSNNSVDLAATSGFNNLDDNGNPDPDYHADEWVFETWEYSNKLMPVLRRRIAYTFYPAESGLGVTPHDFTVFGIIDQDKKTTTWLETDHPSHLPCMSLIKGSYYYFSAPSGAYTDIPIGRGIYDANSNDIRVDDHYGALPPNFDYYPLVDLDDGPGKKDYLLATNHEADDSYMIAFTERSTIVFRAYNPATQLVGASWTYVSAKLELIQGFLERASQWGANAMAQLGTLQVYFDEKYLYSQLFSGWILNRAGDYAGAHDWYRKLYDPFRYPDKYGYPFDAYCTSDLSRSSTWLADSLDPYETAAHRRGAYLRHAILMMVKNLLDWADHEFALANPEPINRARELYSLAERILNAPELKNDCLNELDGLLLQITMTFGIPAGTLVPELDQLTTIAQRGIVLNAIKKISKALRTERSPIKFTNRAATVVKEALDQKVAARVDFGSAFPRSGAILEAAEDGLIRCGFDQLMARPIELPASEGRIAGTFSGNITFLPQSRSVMFSIPPNPLLKALSFHIQSCLSKLHAGRGIGGDLLPQSVLSAASTDNKTFLLPSGLSYAVTLDPPRYRYSYLIERARQQAGFAQQLGAALLQTIEKSDAEAYNFLLAENAFEVAAATVSLKELMLQEARRGKDIADRQRFRADLQQRFWDKRVNGGLPMGLSMAEVTGMGLMATSGALQVGAALIYGGMVLPAILGAAGSGLLSAGGGGATLVGGIASAALAGTGPGAIPGLATAAGGAFAMAGGLMGLEGSALAGGPLLAQSLQNAAGAAGTFGSLALTYASFERRWEDWNLQYHLANIDQAIAGLQVDMAQDRINIAAQDREIGELQRRHAGRVVNFLKTKFSNEELYHWMVQSLTELYRQTMQMATSTALLAQRALEFERQELIGLISGDYWSVDLNTIGANNLTAEQRNAGLLSAERLLTALTQLDAFKLNTDRRLLEISKTISLSRVMPVALFELRRNGRITFNTLMDWFDWDFPGHYLRLIKNVKVTVVALVPPVDGIHAMLSNGGESSVVVKKEDGSFVKQRAMRTFGEEIALDSPYNDSGLFVLDYHDPMFLPFEGLGVETQWTFELPAASNRFNFDTIVDVLLTIDYTARFSPDYRAQVIQRLGDQASFDSLVDLPANFADEWYHFKNPPRKADGTYGVKPLRFNLPRGFFPPHLADELHTNHLTLIVAGKLMDRQDDVKKWIKLQKLAAPPSPQPIFAVDVHDPTTERPFEAVVCEDDAYMLFSTRTGTAPGAAPAPQSHWVEDVAPVGDWAILIDPSVYVPQPSGKKSLVELIDDILLVVTVSGKVKW